MACQGFESSSRNKRKVQVLHLEETNGLDTLSDREREVLVLTAGGYTNQQIGERLIISAKTVDTHRSRIMEKLHTHHRSELVRLALRHGLLKAGA